MARATFLKIKDRDSKAIDDLLEFLEQKYIVIQTSDRREDPNGFYIFVSLTEKPQPIVMAPERSARKMKRTEK